MLATLALLMASGCFAVMVPGSPIPGPKPGAGAGSAGSAAFSPAGAPAPGTPFLPSPPTPRAAVPRLGFTHTQHSAEHGYPEAVASVRRLLAEQPMLQNQHLMGWGVSNPEPSPDQYEFASLDDRIEFIRSTDGIPVITLCCAPDWMKGGRYGETDWSRIEEAPHPSHYDDFADLAATVARRYPDVRYFLVWNELKGFFDEERGRWDYEAYTALYNLVYDALKAVDPEIQVGGPYVPMTSYSPQWQGHPSSVRGPWGVVDQRALDAFEYWLRHKRGADFVVVDGHTATADRGLVVDEFTALEKFSAVNRWIRQRTDLPVWWAEFYVGEPASGWPTEHRTAVLAAALAELVRSGTAVALYWNPQRTEEDCPGCLWTSTRLSGGGEPLPALSVLRDFLRTFPHSVVADAVDASPRVRTLAAQRAIVAVNTVGERVEAVVGGREVSLGPYEVAWLHR